MLESLLKNSNTPNAGSGKWMDFVFRNKYYIFALIFVGILVYIAYYSESNQQHKVKQFPILLNQGINFINGSKNVQEINTKIIPMRSNITGNALRIILKFVPDQLNYFTLVYLKLMIEMEIKFKVSLPMQSKQSIITREHPKGVTENHF